MLIDMSHHLKSERKAMKNKLSGAVKKPIPVKIVHDTNDVAPSAPKKSEYDKWCAEDDLRALQRAAEIKSDKARMSHVKKCANEQLKALKKI